MGFGLSQTRTLEWEDGKFRMTSFPSHQSLRLYVVSCKFKMALCHYPCPEEIDVFTGPHMRMKQLVYEAIEKVRSWRLEESVYVSLCTAATYKQADRSISLLLICSAGFCFENWLAISSRNSVILIYVQAKFVNCLIIVFTCFLLSWHT